MIERQSINRFYKDRRESVMAFSAALNEEYHRLADAGCPVIQVEEPLLRGNAAEGLHPGRILCRCPQPRGARPARQDRSVVPHLLRQSLAQRLGEPAVLQADAAAISAQLDVDVVTFETAETGGAELAEIAAAIGRGTKICIGVVSHRPLQVELPEEVAALVRAALKHVAPERLVLSSDCGFGRQGMSRTHAFYKMIAIVRGANIVRRELGLAEAPIPAADPRFSLR